MAGISQTEKTRGRKKNFLPADIEEGCIIKNKDTVIKNIFSSKLKFFTM